MLGSPHCAFFNASYLTKCSVLVNKYTAFCFCSYNLPGIPPAEIIADEGEFIEMMTTSFELCDDSGASYKSREDFQKCEEQDIPDFRSSVLEIALNLAKHPPRISTHRVHVELLKNMFR